MKPVYTDAKEALAGLTKNNMTIAAGGFGLCGIPDQLITALRDSGAKGLTVVSNNAGIDEVGLGLGHGRQGPGLEASMSMFSR
jgi:3-oxoacid CoA-transferase